MPVLSETLKRLITANKGETSAKAHETEVITVDEVAARVASFYERIRGIVDWREEHLLRKTAIERVLKRRGLLDGSILSGENGAEASEQFLKELIRGGHFPNGQISVQKIETIRQILNKYIFILSSGKANDDKAGANLGGWLLPIASYEVEITLSNREKELGLVMFMTQDLITRVRLKPEDKNAISEDEIKLQIHVATHRALFKMDDAVISYHLFSSLYSDWSAPTEATLKHIALHIAEIKDLIGNTLLHPLRESFYRIAERYDTPYLILGDVISENPDLFEGLVEDKKKLAIKIGEAYKTRLVKLKGRIRRAAFYSTLSIFLTKVLIVLALEVPIDKYLQGSFNYTAISMSVLIPPILMLFLVINAKVTSKENLEKVKTEVEGLLNGGEKSLYYVSLPKKRRLARRLFLRLFYLVNFIISFGLIYWLLWRLNFGPFSIMVFIFFISLVAFAGTRIQQRGRELMIGEVKPGFILGLIDFFFLPAIELGKWLSKQLLKYNAIIFVFNFLIETPLQIFVELFEQWRIFLREKKEEIH